MQKLIFTLVIFASISMSSLAIAQRPGGGEGGQRGERGAQRGERGGPSGGRGGQRGGQRPISPLMSALDVDKDGKLSVEEIANSVAALKTLDKNKDGVLEASELAPERGGRGGQGGRGQQGGGGNWDPGAFVDRIMERDADKDDKLSKEEAGERMSRGFDDADTDKDGYLTRKEVEAMTKQWQGGGGGGRGGRGGRGGGGAESPKAKENRPAFDDQ
ncbi:EF-hand domain-containing protein [Mariniblastus fucicola]|uniref:EF hand n=2 Tax=Mariniblastus fucicola TaxID=980251 RepID=A0A5B9PED5_9BACT|nr:hypothetical protein [Mariniblastus fucicola]QEG21391.1 EF hand [Mariniblastus fucicola]